MESTGYVGHWSMYFILSNGNSAASIAIPADLQEYISLLG